MTPSPQPESQERLLAERQECRLSEVEQTEEDDNQEDSAESGAGYSADCEYQSSESSLSSKQKNGLQQRKEKLNDTVEGASIAGGSMNASEGETEQRRHHRRHAMKSPSERSLDNTISQLQALLPQWNGIQITHPMDPRIDLSTVGYYANSISSQAAHQHHDPIHHTVDHYLHLMEAVRPFFGAYIPVPNPLEGRQEASDSGPNTGSSEGFTAFFTTTQSNTTNSTTSDSNSDPMKNQVKAQEEQNRNDGTEESVSSMVALAPHRRRKRRRQHEQGSTSSSLPDREKMPRQENGGSEGRPLPQQEQNDSSSSSEDLPQHIQPNDMPPPRQPLDIREEMNVPPTLPLVSESSSRSSAGFSSTSNIGASASGSNENSGVSNKGSSGSGSNGSSGSDNEGKGSNSGGNSNYDENMKDDIKMAAVGQAHHQKESPALQDATANDDGSARENRLMDKKRKRMDARREYEEQVKLDMNSSSSDDQQTYSFAPGKPVTLDAALSFSRMARVVIQATPPFLVVHANAAFTRLTGVDSHEVNGRSISTLFSMAHESTMQSTDNDDDFQAARRARAREESFGMNVERLVIANGFDDFHFIEVTTKSSLAGGANSVLCRMCVSPIVTQSRSTMESAVVTDTNKESHHHKRRKHHHSHHEGPNATLGHQNQMPTVTVTRSTSQNITTHYVIQLSRVSLEDAKRQGNANRSEATDILKRLEQAQQMDRQVMDADAEDALDEISHSTDPKEPVEAVG